MSDFFIFFLMILTFMAWMNAFINWVERSHDKHFNDKISTFSFTAECLLSAGLAFGGMICNLIALWGWLR